MASTPLVVALAAYALVCVALAVYGARRLRSGDEFLAGAHRFGALLVIATLITAWTGAGSVVGGVAFAFENGLGALWLYGDVLGLIGLMFLAARIRRVGNVTVPELLERRFGPRARVAATLATFAAYTAIAGTQSRAGGRLLEAAFDLDLATGTFLFALTFIAYTAVGGLMGMALVNLFQGALMFTGLLVTLAAGLRMTGGLGGLMDAQPAASLAPATAVDPLVGGGMVLGTALLLVCDQSTWQRFFAAKDEGTATVSARAFVALVVLLNGFFLLLGLLARALVPDVTPDLAGLVLVQTVLPEWGAAVVLVAFASIIMSTASAYFLSASSNLVKDVYQRFVNPDAPDARVRAYSRLTLVAIATGAIVLALTFPSVIALALFSYYVYVSGVAVPLLAALFWRRATATGALASTIAGFVVVVPWALAQMDVLPGLAAAAPGVFRLSPVLPALAASVLALVVGSYLTAPPPEHAWRPLTGPDPDAGTRQARAVGGVLLVSGTALIVGAAAVLPRWTAAFTLLALAGGLLFMGYHVSYQRSPIGRRLAGVHVAHPERVRSVRSGTLIAWTGIAIAGGAWGVASGRPVGGSAFLLLGVALQTGAHVVYHGGLWVAE